MGFKDFVKSTIKSGLSKYELFELKKEIIMRKRKLKLFSSIIII